MLIAESGKEGLSYFPLISQNPALNAARIFFVGLAKSAHTLSTLAVALMEILVFSSSSGNKLMRISPHTVNLCS
jgi:hypothetical protein